MDNLLTTKAKTFFLITPPRSASTTFRETLNSHASLCCYGEVFGENKVHGLPWKKMHLSREKAIYTRKFEPQTFLDLLFPDSDTTYGINFLLSHFYNTENLLYIDALLATRPKIIYLWRENLIARSQSQFLFKYRRGLIDKNFLENLKDEHIIMDCQSLIMQMSAIKDRFKQMDLDQHIITFEALTSDDFDISDTYRFLGVNSLETPLITDKRTRFSEKDDMQKEIEERFENFYVKYPEYTNYPAPIN